MISVGADAFFWMSTCLRLDKHKFPKCPSDRVQQVRAGWNTWPEFLWTILGIERCKTAPQFCSSAARFVALEVHMDDLHGGTTPSGREQLICHVRLNSRQVADASWENRMNTSRHFGYRWQTRHEYNPTLSIWNLLTTNWDWRVRRHGRLLVYWHIVRHWMLRFYWELMTHVCVSHMLVQSCITCWVVLMQSWSILGSFCRASTAGAMEALRRVTRFLLGT